MSRHPTHERRVGWVGPRGCHVCDESSQSFSPTGNGPPTPQWEERCTQSGWDDPRECVGVQVPRTPPARVLFPARKPKMPSGHAAVHRGSQAGGVATETPLGLNAGARMRHPCSPGADDLRIIALRRERMQMRIWSRPGPDLVSTQNGTFPPHHLDRSFALRSVVLGVWFWWCQSDARPPALGINAGCWRSRT